MRALLLLLVAAGASAQTPTEAVYGTWEATRDTTYTMVVDGAPPLKTTVLYAVTEITGSEVVNITVSAASGDGEPPVGYETRHPYRVDGRDLLFDDGVRVRVRRVGERLGLKGTQDGTTFPEVLLDRAGSPDVPDALRGDWVAIITDDAGVVLDLPVQIGARGLTLGNEGTLSVRYADGLLLWTDHLADLAAGEIQTLRVYEVRPDGAALVLATGHETLRLVRR